MVRQRSPNYPGIDLEEALGVISTIYQKEGRAPFSLEVAATGLGYKSLSGPVRVKLAALRQYGLIDQQRRGEFKLTPRALTLILRNAASREYQQALREAAVEPALFNELGETRRSSSAESLRHHLIVDRNFTDDGAKRFIEVFKSTIQLANLEESGNISGYEPDESWLDDEAVMLDQTQSSGRTASQRQEIEGHTRVPLRLMGGQTWAAIELPDKMTDKQWTQMLAMLDALKPGYVVVPEEDLEEDG